MNTKLKILMRSLIIAAVLSSNVYADTLYCNDQDAQHGQLIEYTQPGIGEFKTDFNMMIHFSLNNCEVVIDINNYMINNAINTLKRG